MASRIGYTLHHWLRPTLVALFGRGISWDLRWRLLLLQPISLITYSVSALPYLWSPAPFTVEWLPFAPGKTARVLVYRHAGGTATGSRRRRLRPLHIDIHGGAFIGGHAESTAPIDERVARQTGAVVLGLTYPFAPEHVFPAAIDEIDAVVQFVVEHAEARWGADPALLTVGGFSAGGNMALAATQQPARQTPSATAIRACVLCCGVLDLRLSPWEKPRPEGMPGRDPVAVLMPLFDAYAAPARGHHLDDARLSPVLAARETLPPRILLCVPGVDILLAEQMAFAERVNGEDRRAGERGRVEVFLERDQNHAYLELPDAIVKPEIKERAWARTVEFLRETYALHGWTWTVDM